MSLTNIQIYNASTLTVTPNAGVYTIAATSASAPYFWGVQSSAADFGITRAAQYEVSLSVYAGAAPPVGQTVDVYMGWGTAAAATFPGGLGTSPVSGYFTGYAVNSITNATPQLEYIGSLYLAPILGAQYANLGVITPKLEFGVVVVINNSGVTIGSTTNQGAVVTFVPIVDEVGV